MPTPKRIARIVVEERDVADTGVEQSRGSGLSHFAGNPLRLQCLFTRQDIINNSADITGVTAAVLATSFTGDAYATATAASYDTTVDTASWDAGTKQNAMIDFAGADLELEIAEGSTYADFVIVFYFGDYTFGWVSLRLYRDGVPTGTIVSTPGSIGITVGSGSPEGVVTAVVGSMYHEIAAGTYIRTWVKATGSGNTGWQ